MSARRELKDFRFVLVRLYGRQMHLLFEQVLLADRPNVEHGHRVGNTAGNPCQLTVDIVAEGSCNFFTGQEWSGRGAAGLGGVDNYYPGSLHGEFLARWVRRVRRFLQGIAPFGQQFKLCLLLTSSEFSMQTRKLKTSVPYFILFVKYFLWLGSLCPPTAIRD